MSGRRQLQLQLPLQLQLQLPGQVRLGDRRPTPVHL